VWGGGRVEFEDMLTARGLQWGKDTKGLRRVFGLDFEWMGCVGGTRLGPMGPGVGGGWRRTGTSGRSVGRGVARRPLGGGVFVSEGCFCSFVVLRRGHVLNSKWVARELSERRNSEL
jgi:hypothetical protein